MPNLNKCFLIGHVGQQPEVKATQGGKTVASFSLATSEGSGDNKKTHWHKIIVWEKQAEIVQKYVNKGDAVHVEGRIVYRDYTDKDNQKRYVTEIIANSITLLASPKKPFDKDKDEIPF